MGRPGAGKRPAQFAHSYVSGRRSVGPPDRDAEAAPSFAAVCGALDVGADVLGAADCGAFVLGAGVCGAAVIGTGARSAAGAAVRARRLRQVMRRVWAGKIDNFSRLTKTCSDPAPPRDAPHSCHDPRVVPDQGMRQPWLITGGPCPR